MNSFTKNKQTGNYDVIGLAAEIKTGPITVTKKDGTTTVVTVSSVSKPFVAKFGPLVGKECKIGSVSQSRSKGSSDGAYCGYPCPVTGRKCCAANGPCHDCE